MEIACTGARGYRHDRFGLDRLPERLSERLLAALDSNDG
jgi:hypothetical protein